MAAPTPPSKPTKRPPTTFQRSGETNWVALLLMFLFAVLAIAGLVWLYDLSPPDHELVCDENSPHSLTTFGTCQ